MTEAQRHQILLDMLAQLGFVTVENVIERLGISPATARRDINKLDESGKLVALVDSSKIGERAGMLFSRADQIAMLITGKNANPQVLQQLEAQGVSILRV